jgi:FkbH-like protein
LDMGEFQVPITDESKKRKQFYIDESERKEKSSSFDGDYLDFLRSCKIELEISRLSVGSFTRVYELTQRTNQMNFSGNHYQKEDIQKIAEDKDIDAYVLKCTDKYGEYGVIGFAVIKKSENRLIDLMFSCRIQSKRVEHAFITFCLKKYLAYDDFLITYKLTDKNRFSAQVFTDFDFDQDESYGNIKKLRFPKNKEVPDDHIINVKTD